VRRDTFWALRVVVLGVVAVVDFFFVAQRQPEDLHLRRLELREAQGLHEVDHLVEHPSDHHGVAAHRGEAQHRPRPGALPADLGRRYAEAVAHPLVDGADDAPLLLQGAGAVDRELDPGGTDDHGSLSGRRTAGALEARTRALAILSRASPRAPRS
jgi:hypothetical protein